MVSLQIPEDLADMAEQVPGLNERVARFIRLEVEQYRQRQARFSAESLALVERAKERARTRYGEDRGRVADSLRNALEELTTPSESSC